MVKELDYEQELGNFVHHFARFEQEMNSHIIQISRNINYKNRKTERKPIKKKFSIKLIRFNIVLEKVNYQTSDLETDIVFKNGTVKTFTKRLSILKSLVEIKKGIKPNPHYRDCLKAISDLEDINKFRNDVIHGFLSCNIQKGKYEVTPNEIFVNVNRDNYSVDITKKGFDDWISELTEIALVLRNFVDFALPKPIFSGWSQETKDRRLNRDHSKTSPTKKSLTEKLK